jgi:hypothetical protein
MTNLPPNSPAQRPGLHQLDDVELSPERAARLAELCDNMIGAPTYVGRKSRELHQTFALEQIAPERMRIAGVEPTAELRVIVELNCPVPRRPPGRDDIEVHQGAAVLYRWPETLLARPLPGTEVVRVLRPSYVYMPNVSAGPGPEALCLGVHVPCGMPLREMILQTYQAFCMSSVQMDERDRAGVLNSGAAVFFQSQIHRLPLSTEPFLPPLQEVSA